VDVAGGKGGLSFELFTLLGIQTTLVEPRTMEMDRRMIGLENVALLFIVLGTKKNLEKCLL
jgi:hypothetical protein